MIINTSEDVCKYLKKADRRNKKKHLLALSLSLSIKQKKKENEKRNNGRSFFLAISTSTNRTKRLLQLFQKHLPVMLVHASLFPSHALPCSEAKVICHAQTRDAGCCRLIANHRFWQGIRNVRKPAVIHLPIAYHANQRVRSQK